MAARPEPARRVDYLAAGLGGMLAAGAAIAVGHLVAVVIAPTASPLLAVGATFIDLTPEWLTSFAIRTFGANDKVALLGGIGMALAIAAVAIGLLGLRRPRLAVAAIGALGVVGALAAVLRPAGSLMSVIPSLTGAAVGMAILVVLLREVKEPDANARPSGRRLRGVSRR